MGFDSFITTVLNIAPEVIFKIQDKVIAGDNEAARQLQARITNLSTFVNDESSFFSNQVSSNV